uniref:Uncharacterized protein n=1 Tax=Cannabis sativa TaxID=3483 RepID=A0A803Q792_CANSA
MERTKQTRHRAPPHNPHNPHIAMVMTRGRVGVADERYGLYPSVFSVEGATSPSRGPDDTPVIEEACSGEGTTGDASLLIRPRGQGFVRPAHPSRASRGKGNATINDSGSDDSSFEDDCLLDDMASRMRDLVEDPSSGASLGHPQAKVTWTTRSSDATQSPLPPPPSGPTQPDKIAEATQNYFGKTLPSIDGELQELEDEELECLASGALKDISSISCIFNFTQNVELRRVVWPIPHSCKGQGLYWCSLEEAEAKEVELKMEKDVHVQTQTRLKNNQDLNNGLEQLLSIRNQEVTRLAAEASRLEMELENKHWELEKERQEKYIGSPFCERSIRQGKELYESRLLVDHAGQRADHMVGQTKGASSGHLEEVLAGQPMEVVAGQVNEPMASQPDEAMADQLSRD